MTATELLIGAVVFVVVGLLAFRSANKYGPRVTLKPKAVDDAYIHAVIRAPESFTKKATKGIRQAGFTHPTADDRIVEDIDTRRHLANIAQYRRVH
jgi:hypothetical protein